jgi:hypothetical protein
MLLTLYEFREDLRRKVSLILRAWQQLLLRVYSKHMCAIWNEKNAFLKPVHYYMDYNIC